MANLSNSQIASFLTESKLDVRQVLKEFKFQMLNGFSMERLLTENTIQENPTDYNDTIRLMNGTFGELYGLGYSPAVVNENLNLFVEGLFGRVGNFLRNAWDKISTIGDAPTVGSPAWVKQQQRGTQN